MAQSEVAVARSLESRRVGKKLSPCRLLLLPTALLLVALVPALARADTHTFLIADNLFPTEGAGAFGPANDYPSSIVVSGLSGTVTKVTATVLDLNSASGDDIDMVLVGPKGRR